MKMGNVIADRMTGLRDEIVALRQEREQMLVGLARQTRERRKAVEGMCAAFGRDQAGMARRTQTDLASFMNGMRRWVAGCRRAVQQDLTAARAAWTGRGPAVSTAPSGAHAKPKKK